MKKRYGLESIIGKHSTLRFPRLVSIEEVATINSILPANMEEIESSFNTALAMKNANPEEVHDQFNAISCEYDEEFPIRVKVVVQGSLCSIEVLDPSVFSLIDIAFDLTDFPIEKFRASIPDILVATASFALIKNIPEESYFLSDFIANTRTILNNIVSYNCKRKRHKQTNISKINLRFQNYLLNIKSHLNTQYYQKRLYHFCYKALKYRKRKHRRLLYERPDYFDDLFKDWEDAYDFAWLDQELLLWDDLVELSLLAEDFSLLVATDHDNSLLTPRDILQNYSVINVVESFTSESENDLLKSFKM